MDKNYEKSKQTKEYNAPVIEKVEFNTQSTTVLGNCSGWKMTPMPR